MGNQSACILGVGVVIIFLWFPGNTLAREDGEYEFVKLFSQWVPSFCNRKSAACVRNFNRFIIAGFLPMYKPNMIVPPFNDSGCELKENPRELEVSDFPHLSFIRYSMEAYWPSLVHRDHFVHWDHHWKEYGKCFNTPADPLSFFETAVRLEAALNLLHALEKKGIDYAVAERRKHDISDIKSVLQNHLGVQGVNVFCDYDYEKTIQLSQVVLCFDRENKIQDCGPLDPNRDLCLRAEHGMIAFPAAPIQV